MAAVCSQSRVSVWSSLLPGPREPVETRPAVCLGGAPRGMQGSLPREPQQHWIESSLVNGKQISADLLDTPRYAIAVQRAQDLKSLEDHKRQRAGLNINLSSHRASYWLPTGRIPDLLWESNRRIFRSGYFKKRREGRGTLETHTPFFQSGSSLFFKRMVREPSALVRS